MPGQVGGEGEIWHSISRWKMLQVLLPKLTTIFFWCVTQCVEMGEVSALYLTGRSDVPCTDKNYYKQGKTHFFERGRRKNEESCIRRKHTELL